MGLIVLLIFITVFLFLAVAFVYWYINVNNVEIKIRNEGNAQQEICEAFFDRMRKTILTQAQVKDDYLNSFQEAFTSIMNSRYGGGNANNPLFNAIKESNPEFSEKIFKGLMKTIESQRSEFMIEQSKLIDIDRRHKNFRSIFPNNLIIGNRPDINIVTITSNDANTSRYSGEENAPDIPLNTRR